MSLKVIGGYEIQNQIIGQGAFGKVYRAKRLEDNKVFAVKKQPALVESEIALIQHEVELIKKMDKCPYVMKTEDSV
ncbi:MAG: hypothetical protein EZS28_052219 [Streblomastix strix]|uniref:Protein kinase domain-containing protein n=1 Tax=Streblomastix strix TaxID=222440 RepID=A0A5J4SFQ2_9EUKA|nr:MAG: hypothetical protein EZS28_052219 [Streblomastix strix]